MKWDVCCFGLKGNGDDKLEVMGGVGKARLLRDRKASRSGTITIVTYCWAGLGCQVGVVVPFRWRAGIRDVRVLTQGKANVR